MRTISGIAIGCALGALVATATWWGCIRWLPWWAQGMVGVGIVIGAVVYACCRIAGAADEAYARAMRAWRESGIPIIGEITPLRGDWRVL